MLNLNIAVSLANAQNVQPLANSDAQTAQTQQVAQQAFHQELTRQAGEVVQLTNPAEHAEIRDEGGGGNQPGNQRRRRRPARDEEEPETPARDHPAATDGHHLDITA